MSTVVIIGLAVGCALLVMVVLGVVAYAVRQKKRAERAIKINKPFGNVSEELYEDLLFVHYK